MFQHRLLFSRNLKSALRRFRTNVRSWIFACVDNYGDANPIDSQTQANYMQSWLPLLSTVEDRATLEWMTEQAALIARHFEQSGRWAHGYWRYSDVRRGISHFAKFLAPLARALPDDSSLREGVFHAAEHFGNWVEGIPEWFDWRRSLFRSAFLGTAQLGTDPEETLNFPVHLRIAGVALEASRLGCGEGLHELAEDHALKWADAINDNSQLPLAIGAGGPIFNLSRNQQKAWSRIELQPAERQTQLDRAEYFVAADAVQIFLDLAEHARRESRRHRLEAAAQKLLTIIAPEIYDVDGGAAAALIGFYRDRCGRSDFNAFVLEFVAQLNPYPIRTIGLTIPKRREQRPPGIGKRTDMPQWLEDGHGRVHNLLTLTQAAVINRDERLACRLLDMANGYLNLARIAFKDGRDDPGNALSVSAVLRGHDRETGYGLVLGVYEPIRKAFGFNIAID